MSTSDASTADTYTIGDLAREFGITTRTIRFYESQGLLAPARHGNRRTYSRRDYTRLKLTVRGKRLGFALSEVRELFELYDGAAGEKGQLLRYLAFLAKKRQELEQQLEDVHSALGEISVSERRCHGLLGKLHEPTETDSDIPGTRDGAPVRA